MNHENAVAAMAHYYAVGQVPSDEPNDVPPSLLDHLLRLDSRQRVDFFDEAMKRAHRILDDFRASHKRAALLIAGDRADQRKLSPEERRQSFLTGALE